MNWLKKHIGIILMGVGTGLLAMLQVMHVTFINTLLLIPLCLILCGFLLYIWFKKSDSPY